MEIELDLFAPPSVVLGMKEGLSEKPDLKMRHHACHHVFLFHHSLPLPVVLGMNKGLSDKPDMSQSLSVSSQ